MQNERILGSVNTSPQFSTDGDLARVGFDQVAETPTTTPVNAIEQFANCALRNYSPRQTYREERAVGVGS